MSCLYCCVKLSLIKKITGKCKCGGIYCNKCKSNHNCKFDYITMQRLYLETNLPKLINKKI